MRSRKYSGGVLVALTAPEQTTVDNDCVGLEFFDLGVSLGHTMIIDFGRPYWLCIALADEAKWDNFVDCENSDEVIGGGPF